MTRSGAVFSKCTFLKSAASIEDLPPGVKPEIAFAGRSNVGKSSLINTLTGQHALARTSNRPGRTQLLNYFTLSSGAYLVDMPGYGYAKAPKAAVAEWTRLIETYLRERSNLKRVFLLIDARHGLKEADEATMAFLDRFAVSYQIILTKLDKLKAAEKEKCKALLEQKLKKHSAAFPEIIATSAVTGEGIEALRSAAARVLGI
jgi:GTP-binding protein